MTCFIPKTHRARITDTAELVPHNVYIPHATLEYHLKRSIDNLVHLSRDCPIQNLNSIKLRISTNMHNTSAVVLFQVPLNRRTLTGDAKCPNIYHLNCRL